MIRCVLALLLIAGSAQAADVRVTIGHVRNARGHVLVALCRKADFLKPHCPWQSSVPAALGAVEVTLKNVPPGLYALQAFHDENDNGVLDRNFFGMPQEGLGFSRDAPMHFGPPRFDAAAFLVGQSGAALEFSLRYY
jgi:uncharacterized protein (DUF2141 family)